MRKGSAAWGEGLPVHIDSDLQASPPLSPSVSRPGMPHLGNPGVTLLRDTEGQTFMGERWERAKRVAEGAARETRMIQHRGTLTHPCRPHELQANTESRGVTGKETQLW